MELFLKLVNGETIEQSVDKESCIIGRSAKCDVVVPHEGMSRQHCQIDIINGEIFVTDLGSTNGVLIDGHKIVPHQRTAYQTFLSLSFGAVQGLVIELEGQSIKLDSSQTDNTTLRRANFTRTVTRSMADPALQNKPLNPEVKLKQNNKVQMWAINILAVLILLGAVWFYMNNENSPVDDEVMEAPSEQKPEENFDRF